MNSDTYRIMLEPTLDISYLPYSELRYSELGLDMLVDMQLTRTRTLAAPYCMLSAWFTIG